MLSLHSFTCSFFQTRARRHIQLLMLPMLASIKVCAKRHYCCVSAGYMGSSTIAPQPSVQRRAAPPDWLHGVFLFVGCHNEPGQTSAVVTWAKNNISRAVFRDDDLASTSATLRAGSLLVLECKDRQVADRVARNKSEPTFLGTHQPPWTSFCSCT